MAAPSPSSLSQVCRKIAEFVKAGVNHEGLDMSSHAGHEHNVEQVTIDNPAAVGSGGKSDAGSDIHRLNLFFYRFEPFEFHADLLPGESWLLRTHCLITPFAVSEDNVSAGENDLRLLGEVMRVFHETPVLNVTVDDSGENVDFAIQALFESLSTESINQIWSTQGSELAFRPSLSYEFSMAPVLPLSRSVGAPLVGATGLVAHAGMESAGSIGTDYSDIVQTPQVNRVSVDTGSEEWAPVICFIHEGNYARSLLFSGAPTQLDIKVAGRIDDELKLYWDVWDKLSGWQTRTAEHLVQIHDVEIDPAHVGSADATLSVPITGSGQATLYAERTWQNLPEQPERTVRSNVLLLTVYEP